jgi:hypothetical protein
LRVHVDEIAEVKKTRDAVLVALLSRLGEIDIGRLVWLKKRRHLSPRDACGRGVTQILAARIFSVNVRGSR